MIEQRVDGVLAAVHEVDDARREAGLLDQLEDPRHRHRRLLGRLEDEACCRRRPRRAGTRAGSSPGKLNGVMAADDADRLADHQLVDARGDVLEVAAHHQRRDAGGDLDVLDAAPQLAFGFGERLAALLRDEPRDLG